MVMVPGVVQLSQVADEWDALATDVDAPPFVRPGWAGAWADAFGAGRDRLHIATVRRAGELVGGAARRVVRAHRSSAVRRAPDTEASGI